MDTGHGIGILPKVEMELPFGCRWQGPVEDLHRELVGTVFPPVGKKGHFRSICPGRSIGRYVERYPNRPHRLRLHVETADGIEDIRAQRDGKILRFPVSATIGELIGQHISYKLCLGHICR